MVEEIAEQEVEETDSEETPEESVEYVEVSSIDLPKEPEELELTTPADPVPMPKEEMQKPVKYRVNAEPKKKENFKYFEGFEIFNRKQFQIEEHGDQITIYTDEYKYTFHKKSTFNKAKINGFEINSVPKIIED